MIDFAVAILIITLAVSASFFINYYAILSFFIASTKELQPIKLGLSAILSLITSFIIIQFKIDLLGSIYWSILGGITGVFYSSLIIRQKIVSQKQNYLRTH